PRRKPSSEKAARNELTAALAPAGGGVAVQPFTSGGFPGANVLGTLPGHGPHASQIILLGAHYDSSDVGPGADDAASGVAEVLEAAHIFAQHSFDRTVVFALFDQEEQRANGWGQGGQYFAQDAQGPARADPGGVRLRPERLQRRPQRRHHRPARLQ